MTKQYRQGDVLIQELETHPSWSRYGKPDKRIKGKLILAYGEATGHAHAIADKNVTMYRDTFLAVVDKPATIVHEEHDPITLPPGSYEVIRQRQQDPRAENVTRPRADYD